MSGDSADRSADAFSDALASVRRAGLEASREELVEVLGAVEELRLRLLRLGDRLGDEVVPDAARVQGQGDVR